MEIPAQCPVCGAYSLAPEGQVSALLAVCDVLVVKALETVGKRIVRQERSRFRSKGTRPWHVMHTLWPPTGDKEIGLTADDVVDKALEGAWAVVPAMLDAHGCCDVTSRQVTAMLDRYVHDLVVTGTAHTLYDEGGLAYRFVSQLGLPVYFAEDIKAYP